MMCSINEEKIIYKQTGGFGSVVYYTCMIIPKKSIQIFRYSSGNLCGTKLFCVGDIANSSFPFVPKLTQEQKEDIDLLCKTDSPSNFYGRITDVTSNYVNMTYLKLPVSYERKMLWSEFCWRNWDFVEAPPDLPA
jgi:hypothetical protein